jgi:biotin transport system substrate-specific component
MAYHATLADKLVPARLTRSWQGNVVLVVLFSALIALTAQIRVYLPFTPVPVTGQTLGVLLAGALLGARRGGAATLLYVLAGAAGLPIFTTASLFGPTGGYLLAFPIAAACAGLLIERGWDRTVGGALVAMLLATLIIYTLGTLWLSWYVGSLSVAFAKGVLPFLVGDAVKIGLCALVLPSGWALLRR